MKIGEGTFKLWTVINGGTYTTKEEALREAEQNFYTDNASMDELYVIFNYYVDFDWKKLLEWAFKQTDFYSDFSDDIEKAVKEYTERNVKTIEIANEKD